MDAMERYFDVDRRDTSNDRTNPPRTAVYICALRTSHLAAIISLTETGTHARQRRITISLAALPLQRTLLPRKIPANRKYHRSPHRNNRPAPTNHPAILTISAHPNPTLDIRHPTPVHHPSPSPAQHGTDTLPKAPVKLDRQVSDACASARPTEQGASSDRVDVVLGLTVGREWTKTLSSEIVDSTRRVSCSVLSGCGRVRLGWVGRWGCVVKVRGWSFLAWGKEEGARMGLILGTGSRHLFVFRFRCGRGH